jgi:hypothetical protein
VRANAHELASAAYPEASSEGARTA